MINAAWHGKYKMPKNPSVDQRSAWRSEHQKNCGCRPMPKRTRGILAKKI